MNVRQKHAHSWVEAYHRRRTPDKAPIWITLDPTPAIGAQESIAQVGGIAGNFRPLTDLIRHIWVFYIVGFDGERQNRLLYAPMRTMIAGGAGSVHQPGRVAQEMVHAAVSLSETSALSSAFADSSSRFFVLDPGGGPGEPGVPAGPALALDGSAAHRSTRPRSRRVFSSTGGSSRLLAAYDLKRTPAETQSEFAHRAHKFLTGQGRSRRPVADVPQQVVDAFYRVRFGHLELEPGSLEELDAGSTPSKPA